MADTEEFPSPNAESQTEGGLSAGEHDPRKLLALHPREAETIFSSQSSYGNNLTADFRDNVKVLSQVYESMQRYLTGVFRREDVFYPELQDIAKDLTIYKRSISDKIPMPSDEQLQKLCLCLAGQQPPFVHILREVRPEGKVGFAFRTHYVAPTDKHVDKVLVGYKSTSQNSLRTIKAVLEKGEFGFDYGQMFQGTQRVADLPIHQGRADFVLRGLYLDEKSFPAVSADDLGHIRRVNQEIYKRLYRPLIYAAIKDRLLLSLNCDDVRKAGFPEADKIYDIVLFGRPAELSSRFAALCNFIGPTHMGEWLSAEVVTTLARQWKGGEISNFEYYGRLAENAYEKLIQSNAPPARELQLAVEVMKLGQWGQSHTKQQAKTSEQNELRDVVMKIRAHGSVYRVRNNRGITIGNDFLKQMLRGKVPGIVAVTDPFLDGAQIQNETDLDLFDNIYVMYRDRTITGKAIDSAITLFEKSEDVYLLRILENLFGVYRLPDAQLKQYIAPVYLDKLKHTIRRSYLHHLPWWSRLFLFLTSSEMSEARLARVRADIQAEQERRLARIRPGAEPARQQNRDARSEVRKLARQRAEESDAVQKLGTDENRVFEHLKSALNEAWGRGQYPIREDLIKLAGTGQVENATRIVGLIDVGAASVREILRIPIPNYDPIYATREYLLQNRDELIQRCDNKLQSDVIVHENRTMMLKEKRDGRRELFQGLAEYLRVRLR